MDLIDLDKSKARLLELVNASNELSSAFYGCYFRQLDPAVELSSVEYSILVAEGLRISRKWEEIVNEMKKLAAEFTFALEQLREAGSTGFADALDADLDKIMGLLVFESTDTLH
ncbi:MAG: hypothetical protein LLG06_19345 [Desulfobacteraceae bacterium]|nr:hypothetical protein [Desulfobacteraceae bacterium]